jgi:hypothetical protein
MIFSIYNIIQVHEWVLGIKPIPESYLDWEIASEINISNNTDIKVTSTGESKILELNQYNFIGF